MKEMNALNVEVNLVELMQIVNSLWHEILTVVPDHLALRQRQPYKNRLTQLANRLEKLMPDTEKIYIYKGEY